MPTKSDPCAIKVSRDDFHKKTATGLLEDLSSSTDFWVANKLNQYTTVAHFTPTPDHDDDGNLISGPLPAEPSSASSLVWDAENRLISATVGSTIVTYTSDYQSRLTSALQMPSTSHARGAAESS